MKHGFCAACLTLLLALQFSIPVRIAAEENTPQVSSRTTTIQPETGGPGIFQSGAYFGPQTVPAQIALMSLSEHPDYSEPEKRLYQEIEDGLKTYQEAISITPFPLDSDQRLAEIYFQVVNDHPELFYCQTGLHYAANSTGIVAIYPDYLYTEAEAKIKIDVFNRRVSEALAQVNGVTDDVEKVLILHDYLVTNCQYADPIPLPPSNVYSAYGALVDQEAVCQGYSLAFKLLMNELNIPCVMVEGAPEMRHIWNAVQLGGRWYHVDATWDDPVPNVEGQAVHNYFLCSNAQMHSEGTKGHYGWDESLLAPWGGAEYDSGWIFNNATSPIYRWNDSYYSLEIQYLNLSHVYQSNTLHTASDSSPIKSLLRNSQCGIVWHDGCLYFIPHTFDSAQNVIGFDLDTEKTVQLGEFHCNSSESAGLRYNDGSIDVFLANTDTQLGSSPTLPKLNMLDETFGLSADGKNLAVPPSVTTSGKTCWLASYDSGGKMTFIGSASNYPAAIRKDVDWLLVPLQASGIRSVSFKTFLLDPVTFAP